MSFEELNTTSILIFIDPHPNMLLSLFIFALPVYKGTRGQKRKALATDPQVADPQVEMEANEVLSSDEARIKEAKAARRREIKSNMANAAGPSNPNEAGPSRPRGPASTQQSVRGLKVQVPPQDEEDQEDDGEVDSNVIHTPPQGPRVEDPSIHNAPRPRTMW